MLYKDMAFKGYSEEELEHASAIMIEDMRTLDAFEEGDWGVGFKTVAWVGFSWR